MSYELGQQYEMRVVDARVDSAGNRYVLLCDDNNPSAQIRIYNILKCQIDNLPETMYVMVYRVDEFGHVKFKQDEARLMKEHYKIGKLYPFTVVEVRDDINTKAPYYVIEDDFTAHRYYFKGEQKLQLNDNCILEVEGFTDKGFVRFIEMKHYDETQVEHDAEKSDADLEKRLMEVWRSLPIIDVGDESDTLELKTSIVFTPEKGEPNIDRQLRYGIIRELVGFMNKQGGQLYIGISDKEKRLVGIEADYDYLNDGEDEYNGSYKPNNDGYELKIRNAIDRLCPNVANSLIDFNFVKQQNRTYCVINVKQSKRPIFMDGNLLYQRQGNRVKLLKGDEITFFVTDRMTVSINAMIEYDGGTMDIDSMMERMRSLLNERNYVPIELPRKVLGEVDHWIVWYEDGTWRRQREKSAEATVYVQVPVLKELKDGLLVFCYEDNKINVMNLKDFIRKVNMNKLEKKRPGWKPGLKPKDIFLMHPTDFLVGYSIDSDGVQHVKLHSIADYRVTAKADNDGSTFLPKGSQILSYAVLGAEHKKKVQHLIEPKQGRSTTAGTALSSMQVQNEIEFLKNTLQQ